MSVPSHDDLLRHTRDLFAASAEVKRILAMGDGLDPLVRMAEMIVERLSAGGKLMLCGNGGSAADAQHLAAELTVRLRSSVNREGIAAMTLATDTSAITACANDYSFEGLYERMVGALGRPGDVLLGITTSGKSPNVIRAFKAAKPMGILCLGFLGAGGGPALADCDLAFVVPSSDTARIQESHITAGHALMEMIEDLMLAHGRILPLDGGRVVR